MYTLTYKGTRHKLLEQCFCFCFVGFFFLTIPALVSTVCQNPPYGANTSSCFSTKTHFYYISLLELQTLYQSGNINITFPNTNLKSNVNCCTSLPHFVLKSFLSNHLRKMNPVNDSKYTNCTYFKNCLLYIRHPWITTVTLMHKGKYGKEESNSSS